jgi:hypothetical protein
MDFRESLTLAILQSGLNTLYSAKECENIVSSDLLTSGRTTSPMIACAIAQPLKLAL